MSRFFLIQHARSRHSTDVCCRGGPAVFCPNCKIRTDTIQAGLEYRWANEFGDERPQQEPSDILFGTDSELLVAPRGMNILNSLTSRFDYVKSDEVVFGNRGKVMRTIPPASEDQIRYWAKCPNVIPAQMYGTQNPVCTTCGLFTKPPRQLTRLLVPGSIATEARIFRIAQNRDWSTFVTQEFRAALELSGLPVAFSVAGRMT